MHKVLTIKLLVENWTSVCTLISYFVIKLNLSDIEVGEIFFLFPQILQIFQCILMSVFLHTTPYTHTHPWDFYILQSL